jgi:hypothetical protein
VIDKIVEKVVDIVVDMWIMGAGGHMRRPVLTRELAHAGSKDAGNRSMRAGGRTAWNEEDYDVAVAEFNRMWPIERELEAQRYDLSVDVAG